MEQTQHPTDPQMPEQPQGYIPRPAWQVWAARGAAVVFVLLVIVQIITIARGGR